MADIEPSIEEDKYWLAQFEYDLLKKRAEINTLELFTYDTAPQRWNRRWNRELFVVLKTKEIQRLREEIEKLYYVLDLLRAEIERKEVYFSISRQNISSSRK